MKVQGAQVLGQKLAADPARVDTRLMINNEWVEPATGTYFETLNPSDGRPIARVAAAGAADVDRAVQAARNAVSGRWGRLEAVQRGELIFALADAVDDNAEALAVLETINSGKIISEAREDVASVSRVFRYYAGWADKIEGRTVPVRGNHFSYTLRQPVGVVGQIIPWNFPLTMFAWKCAPALACGNAVVLKPAEQTPLTALCMARLAIAVGFPPGAVNVLNGPGETTGAALVVHPNVDRIAFTGHVDTAKHIYRNAADSLKRCTFELGGKSANVVFADADLDAAAAGAFHAAFCHAGQCCTAGSRLFVEKRVKAELVDRIVKRARERRLGDPLDERTEQGPLVSREQMQKVLGYVDRGRAQGATLRSGGDRHGVAGFFVEPTVFDDVKDDMDIARDEIFGPVLSVFSFESFDEVLSRANDTPYGLAAAVWTKDLDRAHAFARGVQAGTVWVNTYHVIDTTTPFGGIKASGQGRENGEAVLDQYSEIKTVTMKTS